MTESDRDAAIAERFAVWRRRLQEEDGTPLICIGIGHNANLGTKILLTLDEPDLTEEVLAAFLRDAAMQLDPRQRGAVR